MTRYYSIWSVDPGRNTPIGKDRPLPARPRVSRARPPAIPAHVPFPVRYGDDATDRNTPFVQDDLATLYDWYPGYQATLAFQQWSAYADVELLHHQGHGFAAGRNVTDLLVTFKPGGYSLPASLRRHSQAAVDLFKALGWIRLSPDNNTYRNDSTLRVLRWPTPADREIIVQLADYFDQVATNLTLDWASGRLDNVEGHPTLRSAIERPRDGRLLGLSDSAWANTLGVAAFLYTGDRRIFIPIRGSEQAIMNGAGQLHCSASGVFQLDQAYAQGSGVGASMSFEFLTACMRRGILKELYLADHEYDLIPPAFAREIARGGKPQLFFAATTALTLADVLTRLRGAPEPWAFSDESRLPVGLPVTAWLARREDIEFERSIIEQCFTYEGWMGYLLMREYLEGKTPF